MERLKEVRQAAEKSAAADIMKRVASLPELEEVTEEHVEEIEELSKIYEGLSEDGKKEVAAEIVEKLQAYVEKIKDLGKEDTGATEGGDSADGNEV